MEVGAGWVPRIYLFIVEEDDLGRFLVRDLSIINLALLGKWQ